MHRLANPKLFLSLVRYVTPVLGVVGLALLVLGFWQVFSGTGPDYQQGYTVLIMFVHVPSAWLSMMVYGVMVLSSLGYIIFRHPLADVAAKAALGFGIAFTLISLITGSFWGKPTWGTWWVWDPRLVSQVILLWVYIVIFVMRLTLVSSARGAVIVALLTVVGSLVLIIDRYAVEFWNSIHQGSSISISGGNRLETSILYPLLFCALGATFSFVALHLFAIKTEIMRLKHQRHIKSLYRDGRHAGRSGDQR